jgi:hypothetical protein
MKLQVEVNEAFSVTALEVSSDGSLIVAAFSDGTIRKFSPASGKQEGEIITMPKAVADISVTADKATLLVASDKLYIADLNEYAYSEIEGFPSFKPSAVAASSGGEYGIASYGNRLCSFNLTSRRFIACVQTPSEIQALVIDALTLSAFTASKDGRIRRYNLSGLTLKKEVSPILGRITSLALAGGKIAAAGDYGAAILDKSLNGEITKLSRHTDTVRDIDITADGRFVLAGGDDAQAAVWDMNTGHVENAQSDDAALPINRVKLDPFFRYMLIAYYTPGDVGGYLQIRYPTDKREKRNLYAFRDATLTATGVGYVDGVGSFGKYVKYIAGERVVDFASVARTVHKPERLEYKLTLPRVTANVRTAPSPRRASMSEAVDTEGPVIAIDERGVAPIKPEDNITRISGQITDNSTISWAKVDANPLELAGDGTFSFEVSVPKEGKEIIISAADIFGNAASRIITLKREEVAKPAAAGGKKIALLIGINRYAHLAALRTPEFDARTVGELLRSAYGYEPILLLGKGASRDAVMGEVNRLRNALTSEDSLIVYFAGHGVLDGARAYWQVYDSAAGDDTRYIYTAQLTANLAATKAKQILVISDSCFSGAVSEETKVKSALKAFISSGGLEPVADIGKGRHSVFTEVLVKVLKSPPSGGFTGNTLFDSIKKGMPKDAKQTPVFKSLSDSDFELAQR